MKRFILLILCFFSFFTTRAITLEECYRLSRENYPMLKQLHLLERSKELSLSNISSLYLPQISFLGQASYQSDVTNILDEMVEAYKTMNLNFEGLSKDQYQLMFQITQNIWDGGAMKFQKQTIKADNEIQKLTVDKELDAIKTQINQVYFGILILESNLKLNLYADTLLTDNIKIVESCVNNGTAMNSDLDNIRVELLTLRQQNSQIKTSIKSYKKLLSLMIGKEITDSEPIEKPQFIEIDEQINNLTEMKLFDAQLRKFDAQQNMLNVSVNPHIDILAQGWYGRPGLNLFKDMLDNKFTWNGIASIRFQWNISAFFTRKNHLNSISLSRQSIDIQRNTFLLNLDIKLTQIKNEINKIKEVRQSDSEIVELRRSIREASESKYLNGVITITDLLQDITNENKAIMMQNLHELELLKNIYDLKIALNQ